MEGNNSSNNASSRKHLYQTLIADQLNYDRTKDKHLEHQNLMIYHRINNDKERLPEGDEQSMPYSNSSFVSMSLTNTKSTENDDTSPTTQETSTTITFSSTDQQTYQSIVTPENFSQSMEDATMQTDTSSSQEALMASTDNSMMEEHSSQQQHQKIEQHQQQHRPELDGNLYIVRSEPPDTTISYSKSSLDDDLSHANSNNQNTFPDVIMVIESMSSAIVSNTTFDRGDTVMEAFDIIAGKQKSVMDSFSTNVQSTTSIQSKQNSIYSPYNEDFYFHSENMTDYERVPGEVASNDAHAKGFGSSEGSVPNPTPSIDLVFSNHSDCQDESMSIPITTFSTIPYVHGSYASAAPIMLEDKRWMKILRQAMPEAHADAIEVLRQASKSRTSAKMAKIMKWAENNPVVAAYGMMQSNCDLQTIRDQVALPDVINDDDVDLSRFTSNRRERRHHVQGSSTPIARKRPLHSSRQRIRPILEWDVFLDPAIVKKVDEALQKVDQLESSEGWTAAQMEVDRQVSRLMNRMILAHGSASQLVTEAIGMAPECNFSSIVEQAESQRIYRRKKQLKQWEGSGIYNGSFGCKSIHPQPNEMVDDNDSPSVPGKSGIQSSGIFMERWLRIFSRALQLDRGGKTLIEIQSVVYDDDDITDVQQQKQPFCGMFLCLGYGDVNTKQTDHTMGTMAQSAQEIQGLLGAQLRVVLDLKSRRVPPTVWARLIDAMRSRGIGVEGVGSFEVEVLRRINNACAAPVKKFRFFHSAGDLQKACHANEVEMGDSVFFNGGSLFATNSDGIVSSLACCHGPLPNDIARSTMFYPYAYPRSKNGGSFSDMDCKATIEDYKRRFDLQIGLYVQEFSISQYAIESLVQFTNHHSQVYNLGLAWGGINGKTVRGLDGDGYWSQRYMGRSWDKEAAPTGHMELLQPADHQFVQKAMSAGAWGHLGTVNLAVGNKAPHAAVGISACQGDLL